MDNNYEMGLRKLDLLIPLRPHRVVICSPRRHFVTHLLVLGVCYIHIIERIQTMNIMLHVMSAYDMLVSWTRWREWLKYGLGSSVVM